MQLNRTVKLEHIQLSQDAELPLHSVLWVNYGIGIYQNKILTLRVQSLVGLNLARSRDGQIFVTYFLGAERFWQFCDRGRRAATAVKKCQI